MLQLLSKITKVSFLNISKVDNRIKAQGEGEVVVDLQNENQIIFNEKLEIFINNNQKLTSRNIYIWRLIDDHTLSLERLRNEDNAHLFLLNFEKISDNFWQTAIPNVCGADHYSAKLKIVGQSSLELVWDIVGLHKAESSVVQYK